MSIDPLRLTDPPSPLEHGRMLLAFSGWMDGGDVSTGSVDWLMEQTHALPVAEIDPEGFYIYNFPGSMEISSLFRPNVRIEEGIVEAYEPPQNVFSISVEHNLVLFAGKEPHLNWRAFGDAVFAMARQAGVREIYFVGSVGGMVPHTREPRLACSVSDPLMKPRLAQLGLGLTDYEGPAGFTTYLLTRAAGEGVAMGSLVAEIPAYIQGRNPKGIEALARKLAALLELPLDTDALRGVSDHWEKRIDQAVQKRSDLAEHIHKLEEDYDHEVFDTQMGDLKAWLEQQGIQVD